MIINAENIETSDDSSFISLRDLLKDIVCFGRCRGMVFSDEFVALDPKMDDAISDSLVRELMGVKPVKEPRMFA